VRTRITSVVLITALVLALAACGGSDNSDEAKTSDAHTVDIEMRDIAFSPDQITVPAGKEIRLVFHNAGKVDHDAFIGDEMAQRDHEAEMKDDMGGMHHGDSDAITVKPGKTGTLTHTFKAGDRVLIGCHQPGHYAGGMKLTVTAS
jgi:uncharacterized cupredoxin-like copper-binding protein